MRRVRAGVGLGVLAVGLGASAARAQLRFTWPSDSTIDVARYDSPEECLAAVGRANGEADNSYAGVMRDTLPASRARELAEANAPLPDAVVSVARRCSARFPAATAPLTAFSPLMSLFLAAGRDADADALVERRLKAVPATAEAERVAVLDTVAHLYVRAGQFGADRDFPLPQFVRPVRLAAAERAVSALAQLKSASWQTRLNDHILLALNAWQVGDTVRQHRLGERAIELASALTPADRRSNDFQNAKLPLDLAAIIATRPVLLDSLRQSTGAYIALYKSIWERIGGPGTTLGRPLGEAAPPLEADFWFHRADSTVSRPVKGKVNLVVFLNAQACFKGFITMSRPECQTTTARLRRLARQFPTVEITLLAETRGWFSLGAPPATAAAEAALLAHTWLEEEQLPGALGVVATDFWRLPGFDRRRINRDGPNQKHYSFGQGWAVAGARQSESTVATAFLLDQNGIVVETNHAVDESQMSELISILLARPLASRP
jgi:hypothetical protein